MLLRMLKVVVQYSANQPVKDGVVVVVFVHRYTSLMPATFSKEGQKKMANHHFTYSGAFTAFPLRNLILDQDGFMQ